MRELLGMDMAVILRRNVDMKSNGRSRYVSIGELAAHFGLATHVLRHWEAMGLLAPRRTPTGQRTYRLPEQLNVLRTSRPIPGGRDPAGQTGRHRS